MADLTKDRLGDPHRIARASRYASPENGGDALPLVYGDLTTIQGVERGVWRCPKIDTAGAGTYCVAGHAIHGSVKLFDGAGEIPAGNYTLNLANDFQGQGVIATAAFSAAPSQFVEAIGKGKKDASGALIENPVRAAEDLMVNVWGFSARDIDPRALSFAVAAAAGYKAAGVIQEDRSPADVLTELLGDFLGRFEVDPFGRLRVVLAGAETGTLYPVKALPSFDLASVEARVTRDSVVNQVPLLYGKNFSPLDGRMKRHDGGEATRDAASQALYGARLPAGGRLELHWVRDGAAAQAIQRRIVERFREPARVLTIRDTTFRALEAEGDDYVAFSVSWMRSADLEPLINQIGQVISAEADLREQALTLEIRDTGYFLTRARRLDGSWTLGGGTLLGAQRDTALYA
ncbi:MAG: hypothetical protein AABZ64_16785 [Nitrospinota bacterium]